MADNLPNTASYENIAGFQALTQRANQRAQDAYQKAQAANAGEQTALERAKLAWQKEMDTAGLTGMWQGQWTMPVQQWQAQTFGTWGAPSSGQQTLAAQQQAWQQAYNNALAYGQYYAPGTAPTQGQQTQEAQQQAYAQALQNAQTFGQWFNPGQMPTAGAQTMAQQQQQWAQALAAQQEARAAQGQQQQQAMSYLNLLSQLRGPADWAKYQQVLGSTPQGLRDLDAAAMGQYIPGGGATTGVAPQAANLNTLQQDIQGQGAGTNTMGANQQQAGQPGLGQLPAPNQIAPQAWKNLAPSQQQMLLGAYEGQGWNKEDVGALFSQSLPRYASNAPGAGTWRLK